MLQWVKLLTTIMAISTSNMPNRSRATPRYTEDNFYRKGAFHVQFQIEPLAAELDDGEPDEDDYAAGRRRALQELLLALRDEAGMKVSSFIDVDEAELDEPEDGSAQDDEPTSDAAPDSATAEFVLYNKLGVTSLAKLRKFMEQHLKGDVHPRLVLQDPETGQKFRCTNFTIQYLFHDFTAHQPPDDWERLRELLASEDHGYRELIRDVDLPGSTADGGKTTKASAHRSAFVYRGHVYREL